MRVAMDKPTKEEIKEYLDALRAIALTNMYGAVPYLQDEFPVFTIKEAKDALIVWMKEFSNED